MSEKDNFDNIDAIGSMTRQDVMKWRRGRAARVIASRAIAGPARAYVRLLRSQALAALCKDTTSSE